MSNLKQDLENMRQALTSTIARLMNRVHNLEEKINSYLVPRLQKMDKELIEFKDLLKQLNEAHAALYHGVKKLEEWRANQKSVNAIFLDQFSEFVNGMEDTTSPVKAMTLYQEMMSKFLKLSGNLVNASQCSLCEWIMVVQNEDQQTIGICDNPQSPHYGMEMLAE